MFGLGVVFLALFLWRESLAAEPIMPLDLFKNRIFTLSIITVALVGRSTAAHMHAREQQECASKWLLWVSRKPNAYRSTGSRRTSSNRR